MTKDNAPIFVDVIVTERDNPEVIISRDRINYHRPQSRSWLAKHSWWALHMGYAVHTAEAGI